MTKTPHADTLRVTDIDQVFPAMVDHSSSRAVATAAGDLGPVVNAALRDVLGWRPRVEDPKAFVDALGASFRLSVKEGHTEADYVPRGYAVQADLGAVTGGQASLYRRAQLSRTEILRILEGLMPLRPDADREDMEAYRTIVRGAVESLVDEMGAAGGPRVQMVDMYFRGLTGADEPKAGTTPDQMTGQLGSLRDRFGLTDSNVNTIEEEGTRTSFWTLADLVTDLHASWVTHRAHFSGGVGQGFLGTEMIRLSRLMEAAADQVDQVEAVLDSVMVTRLERRTVPLYRSPGLTLDGMLGWLRAFLSHEGRQLAQSAGRDGIVSALAPNAAAILTTFKAALADPLDAKSRKLSPTGKVRYVPIASKHSFPAGMYAARTRVAVAGLCRMLTEIVKVAQGVGRFPGIVLLDVIIVPVKNRDDSVHVTFQGLNLQENQQPVFTRKGRNAGTNRFIEAEPGSTTADDDSISGVFRRSALPGRVRNSIPKRGIIFAAEDIPIAILNRDTGTAVYSPPPTSWPDLLELGYRPKAKEQTGWPVSPSTHPAKPLVGGAAAPDHTEEWTGVAAAQAAMDTALLTLAAARDEQITCAQNESSAVEAWNVEFQNHAEAVEKGDLDGDQIDRLAQASAAAEGHVRDERKAAAQARAAFEDAARDVSTKNAELAAAIKASQGRI